MNGPGNRIDWSKESAAPFERSFLDADGLRWHVFEQSFTEYDRRRAVSLIFSSEAAVRRENGRDSWVASPHLPAKTRLCVREFGWGFYLIPS